MTSRTWRARAAWDPAGAAPEGEPEGESPVNEEKGPDESTWVSDPPVPPEVVVSGEEVPEVVVPDVVGAGPEAVVGEVPEGVPVVDVEPGVVVVVVLSVVVVDGALVVVVVGARVVVVVAGSVVVVVGASVVGGGGSVVVVGGSVVVVVGSVVGGTVVAVVVLVVWLGLWCDQAGLAAMTTIRKAPEPAAATRKVRRVDRQCITPGLLGTFGCEG
ncbi:MAG TPA: hypothetical protein VNA57_10265 [Acidimicrobiales bacterium]|nr:hypothetical protein [Acidimicrobiales bacterium]